MWHTRSATIIAYTTRVSISIAFKCLSRWNVIRELLLFSCRSWMGCILAGQAVVERI